MVTILDEAGSQIGILGMGFPVGQSTKAKDEGTTRSPSQWLAGIGLNLSLSRLQTFVSLAAGIVSITVAVPNFFKLAATKGELVAIVQDARTEKAVSDATIEILTLHGTVVKT